MNPLSKARPAAPGVNILVPVLAALTLAGCGIPYHVSPAPGCTRYIGMPMPGGCFGTTVVTDVSVAPPSDCLRLAVNNCNGGVLEVDNRCGVPLTLGGVPIAAYAGLDVVRDGQGRWVPLDNGSNFTCEVVAADTRIRLDGLLGDQPVSVSFTKSAPLCERDTPASHGRRDEDFCQIPPR